jgi:hypothetical protein
MTRIATLIAAVTVAGAFGGCLMRLGGAPSVLDRAAFDLTCPKEQLHSQELGDERTVGVSGCGRRATYVYDYRSDSWFLNGAASDGEAAVPTAPLPTSGSKPQSSTIPVNTSGSSGGMTTP